MSLVNLVSKKTKKDILIKLNRFFNMEAIPHIKEIIMEDYNLMLNDRADPKSLLAPELYMDEFSRSLDDFDFLVERTTGFKLIVPDMYNFKFTGLLENLLPAIEGVPGSNVEVSREDYIKATGLKTYRGEIKVVYLVRYDKEVKQWESKINKKFLRYPFKRPSDIFEGANQYAEENAERWVMDLLTKSIKELKNRI